VLKAKTNKTTATNVLFTDSSLAGSLPVLIVYVQCYGRLNRGWIWCFRGREKGQIPNKNPEKHPSGTEQAAEKLTGAKNWAVLKGRGFSRAA
jgi:hypothetical protein